MNKKNVLTIALILFLMPFSLQAGETFLTGFLQGLYGGGLDVDNPTSSDYTATETRLQMKLESYSDAAEFFGRLDLIYDEYHEQSMELELREGYVKFQVGNILDFKIGRQIITWGTGDLVFINDMFAKDYISFFNGRDDQYLKAPQNALRMAHYNRLGTFSIVYSPRFTPNRIPSGERFSYFHPMEGRIVGGSDYYFSAIEPESEFESGEIAARFSRYVGSADLALYFYHGFFKNPEGMVSVDMVPTPYYPELNVYGASVRLPVLGGIAWAEGGFYYSRDDKDGTNQSVANSRLSSLIGFERAINSTLTANMQYQNKIMQKYDEYKNSVASGVVPDDEIYHLLTTRITKLLMMENMTISAFGFYSPSDEDFYGRFSVNYKYTDNLTLAVGANIFEGNDDATDFGSFKMNDNLYFKITYGY